MNTWHKGWMGVIYSTCRTLAIDRTWLPVLFMENALGGEHPEEYRKLLVIGKRLLRP
jgi:hypothetical protein